MLERTLEAAPLKKVAARAPTPETATTEPATSPLLTLQQQVGNAAVTASLAAAGIQAKLQVGAVDDPAEREADRVADQVLRAIGSSTGTPPVPRSGASVRRSGAAPAQDAPGHGAAGGAVDDGVASRIESARGKGTPLDGPTRSMMESGFNADFSGIRVHTGTESATLNQSLNARAFTTGSDIFFGGGTMDHKVLAHELAHTVQQGAAPVRRFVTVADFAKHTAEGTFTQKSTAQKEIEKLLVQYARLGTPKAKPDSRGGRSATFVTIPDDKIEAALALVEAMKIGAQAWLNAHTQEVADASSATGTKTMLDPNRKKRGEGFQWFLRVADDELTSLQSRKQMNDIGAFGAVPQAAVDVDTSAADKLKRHYEGPLSGGLSTASWVLNKLVANDGESTEFDVDLKIPVSPGVFVGGILRFDAKKEGNVEVGMEAQFQAGGTVGLGDIHGALGGYFKASAKTADGAVDLIKYGLYRKCRESSVIPREVASKIWGGDSGEFGKAKSEAWSKDVETRQLQDESSFVEVGATAEVGGGMEGGVASVEGRAQGKTGKRYDKRSLDATKGGAGQENAGPAIGRGAQKSVGRSTHGLVLAAAVTAGPFAGDAKFELSWRDDGSTTNLVLENVEIQVRARGQMPVAGMEAQIVSITGTFVTTVKTQLTKFWNSSQQATAKNVGKGIVVPGLVAANGITNAAVEGTKGMPWIAWASGVTREQAAAQAKKPGGGPTASTVGIELALNLNKTGETWTGILAMNHVSQLSANLPALLKAQLQRRTRLGGAKWNGTGWTPELVA